MESFTQLLNCENDMEIIAGSVINSTLVTEATTRDSTSISQSSSTLLTSSPASSVSSASFNIFNDVLKNNMSLQSSINILVKENMELKEELKKMAALLEKERSMNIVKSNKTISTQTGSVIKFSIEDGLMQKDSSAMLLIQKAIEEHGLEVDPNQSTPIRKEKAKASKRRRESASMEILYACGYQNDQIDEGLKQKVKRKITKILANKKYEFGKKKKRESDVFDPLNPNDPGKIIVGNVVAAAYSTLAEIYYGTILKKTRTSYQIEWLVEDENRGVYKNTTNPEVETNSGRDIIFENVTIDDDGQVKERKEIADRYKLYKEKWF